jgi:uncharacterized protein YlxP (DUF503 family)
MFQPVFSRTKNGAADLFNFLGSNTINIPSLFPSFLTHPIKTQIANIVWIILLSVIIISFYTRIGNISFLKNLSSFFKKNRRRIQILITLFLFFLFAYGLTFFPHIHLDKKNSFNIGSITVYKTAKLFHYIKDINDNNKTGKFFRLKEGYDYDLYIDLTLWKNRMKNLIFEFQGSTNSSLSILSKTTILKEIENKKKSKFSVKLSRIKKLKITKKLYGVITISTDKTRDNSHIYLTIRK